MDRFDFQLDYMVVLDKNPVVQNKTPSGNRKPHLDPFAWTQ